MPIYFKQIKTEEYLKNGKANMRIVLYKVYYALLFEKKM